MRSFIAILSSISFYWLVTSGVPSESSLPRFLYKQNFQIPDIIAITLGVAAIVGIVVYALIGPVARNNDDNQK